MNKYQEDRLMAAIDYAERGWRVLPVGVNKKPLNYNGSTGATTDKKQILRWWQENAFANVGVATGAESFWVVDVDMKDGKDGWASLENAYGSELAFEADKYLCATTATGGIHLLFQWPKTGTIYNAQGVFDGVDIRGEGGYIVVAPSTRKVGDKYLPYTWNDGTLPVSPAPMWARDIAAKTQEKKAQAIDLTAVMTGLGEGSRDEQLHRYAWHLKAKGIDKGLALGFIVEAARRAQPPFSEAAARDKVERAYAAADDRKPAANTNVNPYRAFISGGAQ